MSVELNRALLERYFEAINSMDWNRVDQIVDAGYTKDYDCISPSYNEEPGLEGLKKWIHQATSNALDIHITIDDCFGEADKLVTRTTAEFTEKTTGKRFTQWSLFISYFKDGKIAKEWLLDSPMVERKPGG
jgi:SnoaL-like domain